MLKKVILLCFIITNLFAFAVVGYHSKNSSPVIYLDQTNGKEKKKKPSKRSKTSVKYSINQAVDSLQGHGDSINIYIKQLEELLKGHDLLSGKIATMKEEIQNDSSRLSLLEKEKDSLNDGISTYASKKTGSESIQFKRVPYFAFIADLDSDWIKIHWKDTKGKIYKSIDNLMRSSEFRRNAPLMVTNGGMYMTDNSPEGYLVTDGKKMSEVNSTDRIDGNLNFYRKPNGIFYIDESNKAAIETTNNFDENKHKIKQATQSGPMLLIDGKIHDAFASGSPNKYIRSGVGIISAKRMVFIISREPINFYDFACLFRDVFKCKNALYLDGAISLMYLADLNAYEKGGNFGPMISVTKRLK